MLHNDLSYLDDYMLDDSESVSDMEIEEDRPVRECGSPKRKLGQGLLHVLVQEPLQMPGGS